MINFDNLLRLKSILEKIILITKDTEPKNSAQQPEKIFQYLDMLVHIQSLIISIRAELVEKLFFIRPDLPHEIMNQLRDAKGNIILVDRRKANPVRRKLHTYLANDRRSGIADRRKSADKIRAEIRSH